MAKWIQRRILLPPRPRGLHLITPEISEALPELREFRVGLLHVFLQHTSASLTLNENADPTARRDLEVALNRLAPESRDYSHSLEGPDDMPAHIKATLTGVSVDVPVGDGRLLLGQWQGLYLCEHRDRATERRLVLTLHGD